MNPTIDPALKFKARLQARERQDIFPDYYNRKHLIKICFFIADERHEVGARIYNTPTFNN